MTTPSMDEAKRGVLPLRGTFQKTSVVERDGVKVVRLTLPPGTSVPEHHSNLDVVVTVVRGRGVFTVEGVDRAIAQGDVIDMKPKVRHSLRAENEELELVVVHARVAHEER